MGNNKPEYAHWQSQRADPRTVIGLPPSHYIQATADSKAHVGFMLKGNRNYG
jgi:hypothetical protein